MTSTPAQTRIVPFVLNPTNPVIPFGRYPASIPFTCTASIHGCWRAEWNIPFARFLPLNRRETKRKLYQINRERKPFCGCVAEVWNSSKRECLWNVTTHTKIDEIGSYVLSNLRRLRPGDRTVYIGSTKPGCRYKTVSFFYKAFYTVRPSEDLIYR